MSFYNELKRRNVFRVAIAYLAGAWLLIEVAGTLFPAFGVPDWGVRFVVIICALGFLPSLVISWAYEMTPDGLKRERDVVRDDSITHVTARRLDLITISLVLVALAFIMVDRLWLGQKYPVRPATPAVAKTGHEPVEVPTAVESKYPPNSIAVLPFVNMSDDEANEYFSDGISEELLNLLAKIPELRVISRSSAFSFKGKDFDIPMVAAQLKVANVLEGSVRKAGNRVRITVQLIEAYSDTHLWSETYDRTLDDIFAIQDEIALAVVKQLRITLLREAAPVAATTSPDAYALILQSRHVANRYTKDAFDQAELLLKEALEIDPEFAPAWVDIGVVYRQQMDFGRTVTESKELASAAFQKALNIDPDYAPAYRGLGSLARVSLDFAKAEQYFQQALRLNAGAAAPIGALATLMRTFGRFDESIELARKSISLDPVRPSAYTNLGYSYYYALRLDEAAAAFRKALSLNPERLRAHYYLGRIILAQGDNHAALAEMQNEPVGPYRLAGLALVYHALGDDDASNRALTEFIETWGDPSAFQIAEVYAYRGENDAAFDWLQKSYELKDPGLAVTLGNPMFAGLTSDARYQPFVDQIGLLPYWQEMKSQSAR
jgi:TolB-like protein/Tfp pilus assembly protein PilF